MRELAGSALIALGGLVVYGALTGRLAAMVAALVKPADLIDADARNLRNAGGAVAGTGSTPDVPPPSSILHPGGAPSTKLVPQGPGQPPIVAPPATSGGPGVF